MATSLAQLSACVTRILSLTGFPKELKTRDIQAAFSEWEIANGGFKIKWIDDTSLLVVFQDATVGESMFPCESSHRGRVSSCTVSFGMHAKLSFHFTDCRFTAKRAYLHTLAFPPAIFSSPTSPITALIKPYDGADAQAVIASVNSRQHNNSQSRGHNVRGSMSHGRGMSISHPLRTNSIGQSNGAINGTADSSPRDRDQPSPTLPNLPTQPTLNALISSTLGDAVAVDPAMADPAVIAAQPEHSSAPRIGDPGKRMIGSALGVRHPGLPPRNANGAANGIPEVQRAMAGMVVSE